MIAWGCSILIILNLFSVIEIQIPIGSEEDTMAFLHPAKSVFLGFIPIWINLIYSGNYSLMNVFPMKSSTVPLQMTLILDIINFIYFITDIIFKLISPNQYVLSLTLIPALLIYMTSHIILYICINPGLKADNGQSLKTGLSIFTLIIVYIVLILAAAISSASIEVTNTKSDKLNILNIVSCILAVSAVIVRFISYKGIKSKIRLIKVYKTKKANKNISYV